MLNPQFPFKGNQIILSSERVLLYSSTDGIFVFGKEMVALSSTKTINLDANEKILLNCDKIELGNKAETLGDPIIKGKIFIDQLVDLIKDIQYAASLMQTVAETDSGGSFLNISQAGNILFSSCQKISSIFSNKEHPSNPLSKNTFTR